MRRSCRSATLHRVRLVPRKTGARTESDPGQGQLVSDPFAAERRGSHRDLDPIGLSRRYAERLRRAPRRTALQGPPPIGYRVRPSGFASATSSISSDVLERLPAGGSGGHPLQLRGDSAQTHVGPGRRTGPYVLSCGFSPTWVSGETSQVFGENSVVGSWRNANAEVEALSGMRPTRIAHEPPQVCTRRSRPRQAPTQASSSVPSYVPLATYIALCPVPLTSRPTWSLPR